MVPGLGWDWFFFLFSFSGRSWFGCRDVFPSSDCYLYRCTCRYGYILHDGQRNWVQLCIDSATYYVCVRLLILVAITGHVTWMLQLFFLWPECYNLGLQAKTKWKNSIYDGRFHCKILNCQGCSTATVSAKCVFLLEYVMGRLGLGWRYSSLMLRLIWEKDSLFRGQVRFVWESSKSLYKERRCIDLLKQELEGKSFIKVGPQLYFG